MLGQCLSQRCRHALIKQYAQSSGGQRASRRVFENQASLFQRHTGKPLYELRNLRAILQILEQRNNGYARTAEHPCSAGKLWIPFDGGTGGPIDHAADGITGALLRLTSTRDFGENDWRQ